MTDIIYFGHSCFGVAAANLYRIVFDPYENGSVPGLKLAGSIVADQVICSHQHEDHNAAHLITVRNDGPENPWKITSIEVPHDHHDGAHRGKNHITVLQDSHQKIVHFGDLGRLLKDEEKEMLKGADVIMLPCGGHFTINAEEAKEIIDELQPGLTILMHYRRGNAGYDVLQDLEEIEKIIPAVNLDTDVLEAGSRKGVITLKARQ